MNKEGYWIFETSWTWDDGKATGRNTHYRARTKEQMHKMISERARDDNHEWLGPPKTRREFTVVKGVKIKI